MLRKRQNPFKQHVRQEGDCRRETDQLAPDTSQMVCFSTEIALNPAQPTAQLRRRADAGRQRWLRQRLVRMTHAQLGARDLAQRRQGAEKKEQEKKDRKEANEIQTAETEKRALRWIRKRLLFLSSLCASASLRDPLLAASQQRGKRGHGKTGTDHVFHVLQNRGHAEKSGLSPFSSDHMHWVAGGDDTCASRRLSENENKTQDIECTTRL
jgi:hypothetical protein